MSKTRSKRWVSFSLFAGIFLCVVPVRAELSYGDEKDITRSRWQFGLGGGWFCPLNVHETIPGATNGAVLNSFIGGQFLGNSQPVKVKVRQATDFDTSLFYNLYPWLSAGVFGGTSLTHLEGASGSDVGLNI